MITNLTPLLNRILKLDPEVAAEIYALSGSVIRLNVINTPSIFTLLINEDSVELLDSEPEQIHVRISGTPSALFTYLIATRNGSTTNTADLEISGDISLAQDFIALVKRMDIDWEEQLSVVLGDNLARRSSQFLSEGFSILKSVKQKLELDMGEFLLYEKESVPDTNELSNFNQQVNTLRNDVERLKQRVNRLAERDA